MTENHIASRPNAKPYALIVNVGVKVIEPGLPNSEFELEDLDHTGYVNGMVLDFSEVKQKVRVILKLTAASSGLVFPEDPHDAIGFVFDDQPCPTQAQNHSNGMFKDLEISADRKQLSFLDNNPGSGRKFRFAMFLVQGNGTSPVAVCDPRIIND